jgi:glycosyltransferase involved in cell wall biosynthesis
MKKKLSVVVPCYNEEETLFECVNSVLSIADDILDLELIIVDDCSSDRSPSIAASLAGSHPSIKYHRHERNKGKGAALRTGFELASGDYVAVQDSDLEYDPRDLRRLIDPLLENKADAVFGSRFLTSDAHRVLYFWHSLGNRFLTLISNMLTDLNLTDMETCYKVFRREIIQGLELKENRFGFEPEIVAKVAQLRVRIYEMSISYFGRTYAEGKKIGARDGMRALYCILKYNVHKAPLPVQFLFYALIGGVTALVNLAIFLGLYSFGAPLVVATLTAFFLAAGLNYLLSVLMIFKHRAKWNSSLEVALFVGAVAAIGFLDFAGTSLLLRNGLDPAVAKCIASLGGLFLNFAARKWLVFPEPASPDWKPQLKPNDNDGKLELS